MPEGVAAIEGYSCEVTAFLETLVIGSNVKKVGQSAFYNAHALKEITFKGNVEMLGQSAFFCLFSCNLTCLMYPIIPPHSII